MFRCSYTSVDGLNSVNTVANLLLSLLASILFFVFNFVLLFSSICERLALLWFQHVCIQNQMQKKKEANCIWNFPQIFFTYISTENKHYDAACIRNFKKRVMDYANNGWFPNCQYILIVFFHHICPQ